MAFLVRVGGLAQPLQEDLQLRLGEPQVKPDESLLELRQGYGLASIVVNEVEALLDGVVVPHQVLTDPLEHPPLPVGGVGLVGSVQVLLLPFERLVELEVVQLITGCLEAEDLADQGLVLL